MAKKDAVVTVGRTEAGNITVDVRGVGILTLDLSKVHASNKEYAAFHGFKQRLVDAAALSADTATGKPATPQEKYDAIRLVVEHLNSGAEAWNRSGGEGAGRSITVEAIMRVKGYKTYEEAEKMVEDFAAKPVAGGGFDGDTKKALAFLRTGARVMEAMDAIRKERATAPVIDADKALAELG